jgi:hypothetical protein
MIIRKYIKENIEVLSNQVLLNKDITKVSPSNLYELLLTSNEIKKIITEVINLLQENTNESFEIFCKNLWGYIQSAENPETINLKSHIYDGGIILKPKWSFIYYLKTKKSIIKFKNNDEIYPEVGEIILFSNDVFVNDSSNENDRLCLIGSITNDMDIKIIRNNII